MLRNWIMQQLFRTLKIDVFFEYKLPEDRVVFANFFILFTDKKFLLSSIESNKFKHLIQLKSKFINSLLLNFNKMKNL